MRGRVVLSVVLFLMAAGLADINAAGGKVDVPLASGYLFRGLLLNDEAVLQPMVTVADTNGFAFYAWANMPLTDQNTFGNSDPGDFDEVDLIIEYTRTITPEIGSISVGCSQYLYVDPTYAIPDAPEVALNAAPTRELYAILVLALPLSPTLSLYFDVDAYDGAFYGNFKVSHNFQIEKLALGVNASIGYGNGDYQTAYLGVSDGSINDLNVGVTGSYPVTEKVSLTASGTYSMLPDSDVEDAAEAVWMNDGSTLHGTVGLSYAF